MASGIPTPQTTVLTVKEFNERVNTVLNEAVGEVSVTGEISGYQVRQGKWVSFDLKDSDSVLNCFAILYQLDFPLEDGMEVVVTGTPRIYVPYGKYSFTIRSVQLKGEGALKKAFIELKNKLETEGLFDPRHKRPLPRFPETIGIITSGEGAAVNDILKVINRRWGGLSIYLAPVIVQGKNAPDELVGALNYFNQHHHVDVIIFGRGGGSLEDLQAFNSERVARAIFSSRIPIVSGIGHEHNTSIADFVADVRAATPSNAAEIAVPDREAVRHEIQLLQTRAQKRVQQHLYEARHHVMQHQQQLRLFFQGRVNQIRMIIQRQGHLFARLGESIPRQRRDIQLYREKMLTRQQDRLARAKQAFSEQARLLAALNPKGILSRGYSITYQSSTGKPITSLADIPKDGRIRTQVSDGVIESTTGTPRHKSAPQIKAIPQQSKLFEPLESTT